MQIEHRIASGSLSLRGLAGTPRVEYAALFHRHSKLIAPQPRAYSDVSGSADLDLRRRRLALEEVA